MRYLPGFLFLALTTAMIVFYFRPRQPSKRMASSDLDQLSPGLTIKRMRTKTDVFRSYRVLLDGSEVAQLKSGGTVTLDVPPGSHRLEIEIAFMNAVLDFTMTHDPKRVVVGRGLVAGGNAFTPPVILEM